MKAAVRNNIAKAKIKDSQLEVVYNETYVSENYSNEISKKCAQIVHSDLRKSFDALKKHLVVICEMPEGEKVREWGVFDVPETELQNYIITGYSHGGTDESAGVTIIGQKLLQSGKVLNLVSPFIQFEDEEAYMFAGELYSDIQSCDYEVEQYLFEEKFGIKQLELGFDTPDEADVSIEAKVVSEKPKRKRKSKKKEEVASFDVYA